MNPMQIPNEWAGNYQQPNAENPKPNPAVGVHTHLVGNPLEQQTQNERDKTGIQRHSIG